MWLSDVLEAIGYKKETAEHVQFTGYDAPYDGSIPFHKAVASDGDVLLAWEMNGEPIPREHGVCCVFYTAQTLCLHLYISVCIHEYKILTHLFHSFCLISGTASRCGAWSSRSKICQMGYQNSCI